MPLRPMDRLEYEALLPFCRNDLQKRRLELTYEFGSMNQVAIKEGVNPRAVQQTIQSIRNEAARKGYSPDADRAGVAPPGFLVKGKSTLYGDDGAVKLQWVKTREDDRERWDTLIESIQESANSLEALAKPVKSPAKADKDLLAIYPYGDPHVGLYAWHGDAEDDFDLDKAVEIFSGCTQDLVDSAPSANEALVVFLGDFFHSDDQQNRTKRSNHQLDVDSRWSKVLRVGVSIAVSLIHLALAKHRKVAVIVEIGNHDDHSAIMLAVCLDAFFRKEKRVSIDLSPARFHYHRFGQNLIGVHHGDLVKPAQLPGVMATDRAQDWGETLHRVWYTGHIHSQTRYDLPGCEVESFRILPPRDAWSQSMGYRSGRSMDCIVRHREFGEVQRHTVRV